MEHFNALSHANSNSNVGQRVQNRGLSVELLDTADRATMLRLTRAHVVGRLIKRPDFPDPIINISQRLRRWLRSDVESWLLNPSKK